jgi:hypothetical protein
VAGAALDAEEVPAAVAGPLVVVLELVLELAPGTSIEAKSTALFCVVGCPAGAGAFGVAASVLAAPVELPVAFAELAEVAALAASEAFVGASSALADFHAVATRMMATTNAPLPHTKQFEPNSSLIQSMPPSKLSRASHPDPVDSFVRCMIANWNRRIYGISTYLSCTSAP